jgi:carboxymethylenebutenolidase
MGTWIQQRASDGHEFVAWKAAPAGRSRGGIVLAQEVFGVNAHIRSVADRLAGEGFTVIAPSLFDRTTPQVELGYGAEGVAQGVGLMQQTSLEHALLDVEAVRLGLAAAGGPVAVMGFCWGGLVAWLACTRLQGLAAAVGYYPGGVGDFAAEHPKCPAMLHFADLDDHIPLADARKVEALHPDQVTVHVYPAQHGFNCDQRSSYDPRSASEAWERSRRFLVRSMTEASERGNA